MIGQVINALVTPFDNFGKIDYDEILHLLEKGEKSCNDSFVVASLSGEGTSLTLEEKKELYSYCKKNTKLECIYSLASNNIIDIKKEIEYIKDLEIDYYMIVTPFYIAPNQDGLLLFYKELSKVLKNSKIIICNDPKRTGVNLSFYTIKKLIKTCPNIIGLNECSTDQNLFYLIKKNFPKFIMLIGEESFIYEGLRNGADGIISSISILYGKEIQSIIKDYKYGIKADILISYIKFICSIVFSQPNPIGIKYLLEKKGEQSMNLRLPLTKINDTTQNFDILI